MNHYSFDMPLIISPTSSNSLKGVILFSHGLVALFTLILLNANLLATMSIVALIVLSLVYYYQLHISQNLDKSVLSAVHSFHQGEEQGWSIKSSQKNQDLAVEILPSSFVSNWLVILNFKDQNNQKYSLIIPNDSVSTQVSRQLRVRLKVMS